MGRGAPQVIELEAASATEAREQALRQGYSVLAVRAATIGWAGLPALPLRGKSAFDTLVFAEQLRDLLGAGLSVIEALDTLLHSASAGRQAVLGAVVVRLRAGERLSNALASQPAFPPLLVALVRASELTSDLPQALSRFVEHEQRVAEVRHRITSVAIYPLLVCGVGTAVLLFLMLYVMPRFARVFEGMTGDLPWSARVMVWWAQWLSAHGPMLLAVAVAGLVMMALAVTSAPMRNRTTQRLLAWAPLRHRLHTYFLSRWYRATGMLVEGGIPLPEALTMTRALLPTVLQAGGAAVEQAVRDGHSPVEAHVLAGMATPVAEQLIRAGERTGELGTVLTRVAQFHEAELTRSLERTMRALEPIVMVLVGLGVGVVVVLMYLPIFELAAAIQ